METSNNLVEQKSNSKIIGKPLYIFLIFVGAILIISSFFVETCMSDNIKNIFAIASNLGIGILPTGAIGLILEIMNDKNSSEIRTYKRQALLKDFRFILQNYLNEVCNQYFEIREKVTQKPESRLLKVNEIFITVIEFENKFMNEYGNKQVVLTNDNIPSLLKEECRIINSITEFLHKIIEDKNIYIINEIFTFNEIDLFIGLKDHAEKYCNYINEEKYLESIQNKAIFFSILDKILSKIDELNILSNLTYSHYTIK